MRFKPVVFCRHWLWRLTKSSMNDSKRLDESLKQVRIVAENRPEVEGEVRQAERAIQRVKASVAQAGTGSE